MITNSAKLAIVKFLLLVAAGLIAVGPFLSMLRNLASVNGRVTDASGAAIP